MNYDFLVVCPFETQKLRTFPNHNILMIIPYIGAFDRLLMTNDFTKKISIVLYYLSICLLLYIDGREKSILGRKVDRGRVDFQRPT